MAGGQEQPPPPDMELLAKAVSDVIRTEGLCPVGF